ncbi:MAG: hypothetical protein Q8N36_03325, partial [bacterium]|nr:hypothetical protein [bacterium]
MSKLERFINTFPWVSSVTKPQAILSKPLSDCTVALVTTGGLYGTWQEPFAIKTGQDVDETYRVIPRSVEVDELSIGHLHYN